MKTKLSNLPTSLLIYKSTYENDKNIKNVINKRLTKLFKLTEDDANIFIRNEKHIISQNENTFLFDKDFSLDYLLNNFYYFGRTYVIKSCNFSFSELIFFYITNELIFKHIKEILKESYVKEYNLIISDFYLKFYESKFKNLIIDCNMERFEYYRVKNHCQKYKDEIEKRLKKLYLNSNIIETEIIYMTRYLLNNNKIFEENDEINDVIKKNLKKRM